MALGLTPQQIIDSGKHPLLVIADNWERILLKELAKIQNGYAFSSKFFNNENGLPLIRIRDIKRPETENFYSGDFDEAFLVYHNDILIGMDGDFNASKWPGKKGLLNQRVCRVLFDSPFYEKEFLFLCLQPYLEAIHSVTSAVTVKHLSSNTIKNIPVPLPPLPEQRAIVAKIEALFSDLDKGIADLKKAQDQLVVYRQAVLKKAFEGELTKEWREQQTNLPTAEELLKQIKVERQNHYDQQIEDWGKAVKVWEETGKKGKRHGKPRNIRQTNETGEILHALPFKWKWSKLGNVASKISDGPFGSNLKTSDYVDSGIRVIRLENIGNLIFRDSKKSFVSYEKYQSIKNHSIYSNDIIFSSFIAENVSVASIPKHIELAINKADCFCVRFNNLVYYRFYEFFLSTRSTYSQLVNEVHGATRPRINTTQLKEVLIPLCSSEEQNQIVREIESRLSVCDTVEQSITESLEKAKALRQSILKKAFEGTLLSAAEIAACEAASDYEPASVLLEKIRAEKRK